MQEILVKVKNELILKNYSKKTIKSYVFCLREYFEYKKSDLNICDPQSIKQFLLIKYEKNYAVQTINLYICAIKFYYRNMLGFHNEIEIRFVKKPKKLPIVLSKIEIKSLIDSIKNIKHRLLISLAYGSGLRVSEVVQLRIRDVNLSELIIYLRSAKGNKDRISIISSPSKYRNS